MQLGLTVNLYSSFQMHFHRWTLAFHLSACMLVMVIANTRYSEYRDLERLKLLKGMFLYILQVIS